MIKYQGLSTLEALEGAKRYNQWIAEQFLPFVTYPLLEIGSGTGNLSLFFVDKGRTTLSDIDQGLIVNLKKRFQNKPKFSVKKSSINIFISCDVIPEEEYPPGLFDFLLESEIILSKESHIFIPV